MGDLQPVVVKRYCVNFGHDFLAFIAGMRKNKFEGDRFAEALANNVEEKLGPTHQPRKKTFAFGMDLVHKKIKGLFVSFN